VSLIWLQPSSELLRSTRLHFSNSFPQSPQRECGLTTRSTGPATASAVSLVRCTWCIIAYQAYGACLRGPVSSNVRRHRDGHAGSSSSPQVPEDREATSVEARDVTIPRLKYVELPMIWARLVLLASLVSGSSAVCAADAAERGFIRKGMKEGEVVLKIGKPDHETFVRNIKGEPEEKTWTYFPESRDPQTLTILTLKAGVVEAVERKISR
jgi:hypothetical protein